MKKLLLNIVAILYICAYSFGFFFVDPIIFAGHVSENFKDKIIDKFSKFWTDERKRKTFIVKKITKIK